MTAQKQIYKCDICGNIVEVLHQGAGQLVCCGQPMILQTEKQNDEGLEKHVPVIEKKEKSIIVKVGQIDHPMEEKHYIEWIELVADKISYRKYLTPLQPPQAEFWLKADQLEARIYCNIHGLWKSK